ncbi:putative damage-inducible protein DinB [Deinococcus metalli]|nr:DinB family protein [Deinococcus metalli]MBB5377705.1 putative damage-inducible protein DinB [Deinococcus metalli]
MDAHAFYHYLTLARRDLWAALRAVPEADLARPLIDTDGARCVKDLVAHIPVVEDGWFRGDLLGVPFVMERFRPEPQSADEYWHHQDEPLEDLLAYWEAVEADTLERWPALMEVAASGRRVKVDDSRPETFTADEAMWHVMQHEVRHSAQIVLLLRMLGHRPPSLDLVFLVAH